MPDFQIKVSVPADLSGAQATATALNAIAQQAGVASTGVGEAIDQTGRFVDAADRLREANGQFVAMGNATDRLRMAAAAVPSAPLGQLAAAARQIAANAQAANTPMRELVKLAGDVGSNLKGMAIGPLEEFGHKFVSTMHEGIEYAAGMQSATITLATAMLAVRPDIFKNITEAMPAASAMDTSRDKAIAAGVPFESLRETYAVAFPALVESGITGLQEQQDVILGFSRALQSENIHGSRAMRDMLDELNGNGERTVSASCSTSSG